MIVTTLGATRLASALSNGVPLVLTSFAIGDGSGSPVTTSPSMTALVNETARVPIAVAMPPDKGIVILVSGIFPDAVSGGPVLELGVFNAANELIAVEGGILMTKPTGSSPVTISRLIDCTTTQASWFGLTEPQWISAGPSYYGDGADGDAVMEGTNTFGFASLSGTTYTLSRDVYLNNLTLSGTVDLDTGRYILNVNGTAVIPTGTKVHSDGVDASGATAPVAPASNVTSVGSAGGGGGTAGVGSDGASITNAAGGAGGAGGNSAGSLGGAAGSATRPVASLGGLRDLFAALHGQLIGTNSGTGTMTALRGGAGGGGGAGSGTGGGAGGGGHVLCARIRKLILGGSLSANGGKGANAVSGNSGGGGGGGGGYVGLACGSKSGDGTITASGGAHGTKLGTGIDGVVGFAGTVVILVLGP